MKQIEGDFNKGYNNITLAKEDLTSGLLHYQLVTPMGTVTKKMIPTIVRLYNQGVKDK